MHLFWTENWICKDIETHLQRRQLWHYINTWYSILWNRNPMSDNKRAGGSEVSRSQGYRNKEIKMGWMWYFSICSLEKLLEETFRVWATPENMQVLASIIPNCFLQAAEIALPSKPARKTSKSTNHLSGGRLKFLPKMTWLSGRRLENLTRKNLLYSKVKRRANQSWVKP